MCTLNAALGSRSTVISQALLVLFSGWILSPSFQRLCLTGVLLPNVVISLAYYTHRYGAAAFHISLQVSKP